MGTYPPRVALALRVLANQRLACGIGVSTSVRGGVDQGELDFRRRCVGIVNIWKDA